MAKLQPWIRLHARGVAAVLVLLVLLTVLLSLGYHSFREARDQHIFEMKALSMYTNLHLIDAGEKPLEAFQAGNYMVKKLFRRKITYADTVPNLSLYQYQEIPSLHPVGAAERLENLSNNLLFNPDYAFYRHELAFTRPLLLIEVFEDPQSTAELILAYSDLLRRHTTRVEGPVDIFITPARRTASPLATTTTKQNGSSSSNLRIRSQHGTRPP